MSPVDYSLVTGFVLFAVSIALYPTMWYIRSRLPKLPYSMTRLHQRFFMGCVSVCSLVGMLAGLLIMNVPDVVALPVVLVICSMVVGVALRIRKIDREAFAESLEIALQNEMPLDAVADVYAISRFDTLSERSAKFATHLRRGKTAIVAAGIAGLRLPLRTQAGLESGMLPEKSATPELIADDSEIVRRVTLLAPYMLAVITMIACISTFLAMKILPTIHQLFEEFGMGMPAPRFFWGDGDEWVRLVFGVMPTVMIFVTILFMLLVLAWLLLHMGRGDWLMWIPIIGPYYRDLGRSQVLDALALLISSPASLGKLSPVGSEHENTGSFDRDTRSIEAALQWLSKTTPDARKVGSFRKAADEIRRGVAWTSAMVSAGLVDERGVAWLQASESTGRVSKALGELAVTQRRRAAIRRAAGLSIVFPICILLISIPVLVIAATMIQTLYGLVEQLA